MKHARRLHRALKNTFIPHRGNRYRPHALHPKHTFLYAVFFTLLKGMLIVVALLIPAEAFVSPDVLNEQATKIIQRTNEVRIEQGLPPLTIAMKLNQSADAKAKDMAEKQYFSHVSPDGHRLGYFLSAVGYPYAEAGENLAMGFSDADGAMNGWMKSPTHYANLVDPTFKEIGVGIEGAVYQGKPTVFVAQHFGERYEAISPPTSKPTETLTPAPAPMIRNEHPVTEPASSTVQIAMRPTGILAGKPTAPPATKPTVRVTHPTANRPVVVAANQPAQVTTQMNQPSAPAQVEAVATPEPAVSEPTQASTTLEEVPIIAPSQTFAPLSNVTPYAYNADRSFVQWQERDNRVLVEPRAFISGDIASVTALIGGYSIALHAATSSPDVYTAALTLPESSNELFRVILPPTLEIKTTSGQVYGETIEWQNPKVVSDTPWQRYLQAKSWLYQSIPVFMIVHWFYIAALIVLGASLILSIVIEVRKQHPHVVIQTIALLFILGLYIKF